MRRYSTPAATAPASSHAALAPRSCRAEPATVTARTPPPYSMVFAAIATTSATVGAGRSVSAAVKGSAPRSIDNLRRLSSSKSVTNETTASEAAT